MHELLRAMQERCDEFVSLRRDFHQHPELGFQEVRTSDIVAQLLQDWGYQVTRGLGGTGLVGQLRRGSGSRRLGLRAEMDALPIQETSGLPHASRHAGIMHGCGHDGHTVMLLAAAKYLAEEGRFDGTLQLIFQPAEEGLGGAKKMMEDGLFAQFPCDAVFAMHNLPGIPAGELHLRAGATMSSSENINVVLTGRGGHGAMPQHTADPVVAGAAIVTALQTIVSRNVAPLQMAVITVGAFLAGDANNVIPDSATLRLSVRTMDRQTHELVKQRIAEMVHAQAASYGVQAEIVYGRGYPVLVNSVAETAFATDVALALLGASKVVAPAAPVTASEDFAFMLEEVPGCYLFIGNGDEAAGPHWACSVHNPQYDFNDANIATGSAYWILLAQRFLV